MDNRPALERFVREEIAKRTSLLSLEIKELREEVQYLKKKAHHLKKRIDKLEEKETESVEYGV